MAVCDPRHARIWQSNKRLEKTIESIVEALERAVEALNTAGKLVEQLIRALPLPGATESEEKPRLYEQINTDINPEHVRARAWNCVSREIIYGYGPTRGKSGPILINDVLRLERPDTIHNLGFVSWSAICGALRKAGIDYQESPWYLTAPKSWRTRIAPDSNGR